MCRIPVVIRVTSQPKVLIESDRDKTLFEINAEGSRRRDLIKLTAERACTLRQFDFECVLTLDVVRRKLR
jgi:hypothetical protein